MNQIFTRRLKNVIHPDGFVVTDIFAGFRVLAFDLETTGLNQFHDRITEVCFIKEKNG